MIHLTIPGPPPRQNRMYERRAYVKKGRAYVQQWLSSPHCDFRTATWDAWADVAPPDALTGTGDGEVSEPYITAGAWKVTIAAYWPRQRHLDLSLPNGDCDAPIKAILDALEFAGVIDDDARVVEIEARKFWDKERPRVEVSLEPAVCS